jgi:hypothetical protein
MRPTIAARAGKSSVLDANSGAFGTIGRSASGVIRRNGDFKPFFAY